MTDKPKRFEPTIRRSVQATAEVYFPQNDDGVPDWQETDMVERTMHYLEELPPETSFKIRLLYVVVEWLGPLGFAGLGRFSKKSLAFRQRVIHRWAHWNFFLYRMLFDALKAQLTMTYLSHPLLPQHMGIWKTCSRETDPYNTPIRKGFLEQFAEEDAQKHGASAVEGTR